MPVRTRSRAIVEKDVAAKLSFLFFFLVLEDVKESEVNEKAQNESEALSKLDYTLQIVANMIDGERRAQNKIKIKNKKRSQKRIRRGAKKSSKKQKETVKTKKVSKSKHSDDEDERRSKKYKVRESDNESEFDPESKKNRRSRSRAKSPGQNDYDAEMGVDPNFPECFVQYNNRVEQMIKWFYGNASMKANYDKLQDWAMELNADDEFGMDLTNFMFYCGGIRTWELNKPDLTLNAPVDRKLKWKIMDMIEISVQHSPDKQAMIKKVREELGISDEANDVQLDKDNGTYMKWHDIFVNGKKQEILFFDKRKLQQDQMEDEVEKEHELAEQEKEEDKKDDTDKAKILSKKQLMTRYKSFWQHIINALEDLLYDNRDDSIACILRFCELLARESKITHLRKVGVYTAICIGSGCVHLMAKARQSLEKCERRLRAEKALQSKQSGQGNEEIEDDKSEESKQERKKRNHQAKSLRSPKKDKKSAKMTKLEESAFDFRQRIEAIQKIVTFIFENVIVYKSKDSNSDIRIWALNCITEWVNADPSPLSFFNDTYWRYLQGALSDRVLFCLMMALHKCINVYMYKCIYVYMYICTCIYIFFQKKDAKVRECALTNLQSLFDPDNRNHGKNRVKSSPVRNKGQDGRTRITSASTGVSVHRDRMHTLSTFWDRIKHLVFFLVKDANASVASNAIALINLMLRNDQLAATEGDEILDCFLEENDEIRKVGADFIFYDTFDDAALMATTAQDYKRQQQQQQQKSMDASSQEPLELKVTLFERYRDDLRELISLVRDRIIGLNTKVLHALQKAELCETYNAHFLHSLGTSALYYNYEQVCDYLIYGMQDKLVVLSRFDMMIEGILSTEESQNDKNERMLRRMQLNAGHNKKNSKDAESSESETDIHNNKKVLQIISELDLDDFGQTILCFLMLSAMKAANGRLDALVSNPRKPRATEKANVEKRRAEQMTNICKDVLPSLPTLLRTFQTDPLKSFAVIQMVSLIPISGFNSSLGKQCLDEILASLKNSFFKHEIRIDHWTRVNWNERWKQFAEAVAQSEPKPTGEPLFSSQPNLAQDAKYYVESQMYSMIGKSLAHLTFVTYDYKHESQKSVFDMATDLAKQLHKSLVDIQTALDDGVNLHRLYDEGNDKDKDKRMMTMTTKALKQGQQRGRKEREHKHTDDNEDDDNNDEEQEQAEEAKKCLQDCFSNLYRMNGLLQHMNIGQLSFGDELQQLLDSVVNDHVHHSMLEGLVPALIYCIMWQTKGLDHTRADANSIGSLQQLRSGYCKVLHFLCQKLVGNFNDEINEWREAHDSLFVSLSLDLIDILPLFCPHANENELTSSVFNRELFDENSEFPNLKDLLLQVLQFALSRPLLHDPLNPSIILKTEHDHMRALMSAARLCIYNCVEMLSFGTLVISKFHYRLLSRQIITLPGELKINANVQRFKEGVSGRFNDITRQFLGHLDKTNHVELQLMMLDALKMLCNDESVPVEEAALDTLCKALASVGGVAIKSRAYFQTFVTKTLDLVLSEENCHEKKYFVLLPGLLHFIRRSRNRDKITFWEHFKVLEGSVSDLLEGIFRNNVGLQLYFSTFKTELEKNWNKSDDPANPQDSKANDKEDRADVEMADVMNRQNQDDGAMHRDPFEKSHEKSSAPEIEDNDGNEKENVNPLKVSKGIASENTNTETQKKEQAVNCQKMWLITFLFCFVFSFFRQGTILVYLFNKRFLLISSIPTILKFF
ncbi:Protein kinase domain containing protein [Reticulomyxa filosa]|uniref:Protein kinase domain containing protein n=1 Tax=Reticulomyxa filosa TaxID=46433 RepID=X6NW54_RETFI|nr:Protein kinase domain containing protein [Reticulomyxa filosa]|eukprot:ETO29502.1 Protein kinase domain containing protein [Reticulomyxa filosa]